MGLAQKRVSSKVRMMDIILTTLIIDQIRKGCVELSEKIGRLKLEAANGKKYETEN